MRTREQFQVSLRKKRHEEEFRKKRRRLQEESETVKPETNALLSSIDPLLISATATFVTLLL